MPGLYGICSCTVKQTVSSSVISANGFVENQISFKDGFVGRKTLDRFMNDKVFFEDSDAAVALEGIVFNWKALRTKYAASDNSLLLKRLFRDDPAGFPEQMHGNFTGFIYDKQKRKAHLFTNSNGTKQMFYYFNQKDDVLVFGNEVKTVVSLMRRLGYTAKLSEDGALCMLSVGYMIGDTTGVEGVKKLDAGSILAYEAGKIEISRYKIYSSYPITGMSEDDIIEELDSRFIHAVKDEYEKDIEYGYRHLSTLSGGMDSRMNVLNAHRLGYKNMQMICFSQSNYLDELIAKQIAADFRDEFMFYALDNGTYLKDIESSVSANDGLIFYSGSSYMYTMISKLNLAGFGLIHTGVAGNEVLYTSLQKPAHETPSLEKLKVIFYSTKHFDRVEHLMKPLAMKYPTMEILAFYEKCVNGMYNAFTQIQQFTEFASPSIHPYPLEFIMSIDPKLKFNAKLYIKWALKKTPHVNDYRWEHIAGARLSSPSFGIFLRKARKKAASYILGYRPSKNPWARWMKENDELMGTLDGYFNENIGLISMPNIKKHTEELYFKGTLKEKTQALTLLSSIKLMELK